MTLILLGLVIDFRFFRKETKSAIIHRFEQKVGPLQFLEVEW